MPLGLTYAQAIATLGAAILMGESSPQTPSDGAMDVVVSLGGVTNYSGEKTEPDVFFTLSATPDARVFDRFSMVYGLGVADTGALFLSAGLGKSFSLGAAEITPFVGPALYQSDITDGFSGSELIQFRSGLDLRAPIGAAADINLGWYHISNMRNDDDSADTDVAHLGLSFRF